LKDGMYVIVEDLPASRAILLVNESIFASENYEAQVGNLTIYDKMGVVYFENLFHSLYGPLVAQVDFIPWHTIEIIGKDAQISAFYTSEIPDNPYVLMDPLQVLQNLGRIYVQNQILLECDIMFYSQGIYEVGFKLTPHQYKVLLLIDIYYSIQN